MNSIAEIIEALLDGSLAQADLARAIDEVTMRADFDAAEALSTLERHPRAGDVDAGLKRIISNRIQSRPASTGPELLEEDESATVFQSVAPPPPDVQPTPQEGSPQPVPPPPAPPSPADETQIAPQTSSGDLTKGVIINNRFKLEELLGSGGMSHVYKATDVRKVEANDRNPYVAIKVLKEDFRARPDALMTLQREARRAQGLAHPNIVRVYDFDRDGDTIYLTMEFLEGKGLDQVVRMPGFHGMPHDEALKIVNQIGQALVFAHDHDTAHCDLKPGNIFVSDSGQVKVIDFGISRSVRKPEESGADATHFDPGAMGALTPAYASPELIEENEAGVVSDIFALAVVVCEIFGGHHPFDRIDAVKARDRGLTPTMPKGISRTQASALQGALEFDPKNRTSTVREFLDGLNASPKSSGLKMVGLTALVAAVAVVVGGSVIYYDRIERSILKLTSPTPEISQGPATGAPPAQSGILNSDQIKAGLQTSSAPAARPVDPVLKQLNEVFEGFPCAQLRSVRDGASVKISGYLHPPELAKLKAAVLKLDSVSSVTAKTHPISDEQCSLLRMIAPFVARNRLDEMGLSIVARNPTGEFKEAEKLVIRFRTPKSQTHLYIDYFSLDGQVVHMLPDPNFANIPVAPNLEQSLGDDPSAVQWTVGPPFGVELIIALAIPTPLFETARPEFEDRSVYLKALKQELRKIVRREDGPPVAADFVFLKTGPTDQ